MICYIRCSNVQEDIRLKKYILACKENNIHLRAITWDRLRNGKKEDFEISFKKYAPYGRRWKNLPAKFLWQFFILKNLIYYRKEYKIIHACDFDTMLPALFLQLFSRKKVIYDIYDSVSVKRPRTLLQKFVRWWDIRFLKRCNCLILADEKRIQQVGLPEKYKNKIFVVENVPKYVATNEEELKTIDGNVQLAYVGVFDRFRGLEDLLSVVAKYKHLYLNIAGTGTLQPLIEQYASKCKRIIYWGTVPYDKGLVIMRQSHLIVGMYYKIIENHIYAAPNKFYESLFLGRPLITTERTLVGEKVTLYNCGYALPEGEEALRIFFDNILTGDRTAINKDYREKCLAAALLWKKNYIHYYENRIKNEYIKMFHNL